MGGKEGGPMIWLMITACGGGSLVRYFLSKVNSRAVLPVGTLMANLLGAFLIGYFYNHIQDKQLYTILATGFCGGLTTFSSLMLDAVKLLDTGSYPSLIIYLVLSIGGGLLLAYYLGRKKW